VLLQSHYLALGRLQLFLKAGDITIFVAEKLFEVGSGGNDKKFLVCMFPFVI